MTEEQEKYIIEKYPFFWDGVYVSKIKWTKNIYQSHAFFAKSHAFFAKYININKKVFTLEEREKIPQLLTNKSYTNFKKYISILARFSTDRACINRNIIKYILYFVKPKTSFDDFEKYFPFCITIASSLITNENMVNLEKNMNTIIDDAMLVYEIVRPDIIYNACLTKNMVLLKNNFNRINQILLKYNKYVYYQFAKDNIDKFINPTKTKQFKYFIKLLVKNEYIKYKKSHASVTINDKVISKTVFSNFCLRFMKELYFYNSKIFEKKICKFFNLQRTISVKQQKKYPPYKLQLIFDEVRKYDNKIINQQKTNK
jgi:hypothetical protein